MPVTPPLDKIPALPAKGVSLLMNQINTQVSKLVSDINKLLESINKLSETTSCDDPKTKQAKNDLSNVLNTITKLQELPSKIQPVVSGLQSAVTTAQAIKAAQLLNPVTAPAIIAAELLIVQNMTIANSIQAINQLSQIPDILKSALTGISLPLNNSLDKLATVCDTEQIKYELPTELIVSNEQDIESEFYNTLNVSDSDLTGRADTIQTLVEQQQDLLSSLQEAPSKVYKGKSSPKSDVGKPGDYFIDTVNQIIYGPKITRTEWPSGVNY
jgi:septation ring formation regulator EzrA